jgi:hypothetical protein
MQWLSPEKRRDLVLSLKTHRSSRPLSPVEVAEALDMALEKGMSFGDIAVSLGFEDTSTLKGIHRLLNLVPDAKRLVGWGRSRAPLSMTAASYIARLRDTADQQAAVEAVLLHSLNSEETRQIVEARTHSKRPISECIDALLRLRPRIERKALLIGAVISERVRSQLERMTQTERDQLLIEAVRGCIGQVSGWTGGLGPARFTLLGSEAFGTKLRGLPNGFEAAVNACLEAKMDNR